MDNQELVEFTEILDALSQCYDKDPLKPMAVKIYFNALVKYPLESIKEAVNRHLVSTKSGTFYPKVADLVRQLEGEELTPDTIIAAARLKNTPLGCLCAIHHLVTHDLNNMDGFGLRAIATQVLQELPEMKARCERGEYTDHEISIMLKHGVSPIAPFAFGLTAPSNPDLLLLRASEIEKTPRHAELLEPPYEGENDKVLKLGNGVQDFIDNTLDKLN